MINRSVSCCPAAVWWWWCRRPKHRWRGPPGQLQQWRKAASLWHVRGHRSPSHHQRDLKISKILQSRVFFFNMAGRQVWNPLEDQILWRSLHGKTHWHNNWDLSAITPCDARNLQQWHALQKTTWCMWTHLLVVQRRLLRGQFWSNPCHHLPVGRINKTKQTSDAAFPFTVFSFCCCVILWLRVLVRTLPYQATTNSHTFNDSSSSKMQYWGSRVNGTFWDQTSLDVKTWQPIRRLCHKLTLGSVDIS